MVDNILKLEDGAETELNVRILQQKTDAIIESIELQNLNDSGKTVTYTPVTGNLNLIKVNHTSDWLRYKYRITEGYSCYFAGNVKLEPTAMNWTEYWHPSGEYIYGLYSNVYSVNHYTGGSMKWYTQGPETNPIWGIYCSSQIYTGNFSTVRDTSYDGKEYYEEDFKAIPWFWCPGGSGRAAGVYGVNAERFASNEKSLRKEELTNKLVLTVYHNGKKEKIPISIYVDSYECSVDNK